MTPGTTVTFIKGEVEYTGTVVWQDTLVRSTLAIELPNGHVEEIDERMIVSVRKD